MAIKIIEKRDGYRRSDEREKMVNDAIQKSQIVSQTKLRGIPLVIESGISQNQERYYVMEQLGLSIEEIFERNNYQFSYG